MERSGAGQGWYRKRPVAGPGEGTPLGEGPWETRPARTRVRSYPGEVRHAETFPVSVADDQVYVEL